MENFHPPLKNIAAIREIGYEGLEPVSSQDLSWYPSPGHPARRWEEMEIEMKKRAVSEAQSVFATPNDRTSINDSQRHYTSLNWLFEE